MANELQPLSGGDIIQQFRQEVDRLFNQFGFPQLGFSTVGRQIQQSGSGQAGNLLVPPAEVVEDDAAYRITVEVPGIDPKNIEINQSGNTLTVRAERRHEEQQRGRNHILNERSYGTLRRQFQVPNDVNQNQISAEFRNGLLTVTLPRSQEARNQRRQIEIKSA